MSVSVSRVARTIKTAVSRQKTQEKPGDRAVVHTGVSALHFCSLLCCCVLGIPSCFPLSSLLSFAAAGLAGVSVLYISVSWNKISNHTVAFQFCLKNVQLCVQATFCFFFNFRLLGVT